MLVSDIPALRDYWYPVGYTADVGSDPYRFRVFGADFVLWRPAADAPVRGARDECPHRGARLSDGWVDEGCLTCPYHGWRYDESGRCVQVPANEPSVPIPPRAHLDSIAVSERYGLVWVCVGSALRQIPTLTEADDPAYTLAHEVLEVWTASAPRIIDNALDIGHVPFAHRRTVGTPSAPRIPAYQVEREGDVLRCSLVHQSRVDEQQKRNTGITTDVTTRTTHIELIEPLMFRGAIEYENGLIHVLFKTATPIDDRTTLFCQFIARNDHPDAAKLAGVVAVDRAVQAEDRALLEQIRPDLPTDITVEVHVPSDRLTIEYRRLLGRLSQAMGRSAVNVGTQR